MTDDAVDLDDLGIDVATAELDDDELTRVLEALLLVVDTPVSVQTLATVTEQPVYRVTDKLQQMAAALTERDSNYAGALPDVITIYRGALLEMCDSEQEVVDEVAVTVVHELAHHFGIDDDRLHELGWG